MTTDLKDEPNTTAKNQSPDKCGIVMPISGMGEYSDGHWIEVLEILKQAVEVAGFEANLVSNADDVGIIQKRIVQNLYDNPILVCDVSGKNPNVMFELGMRLAFDKPTIIVKDSVTSYSFDTSPIEHLEYPRDLRYKKIVEFKKKLADKILATYATAKTNQTNTTFLKSFGEFTVAKLEQKEVTGQEFVLDELRSIRSALRRIERPPLASRQDRREYPVNKAPVDICLLDKSSEEVSELSAMLAALSYVDSVVRVDRRDHQHLVVHLSPDNIMTRKRLDAFMESRNLGFWSSREDH